MRRCCPRRRHSLGAHGTDDGCLIAGRISVSMRLLCIAISRALDNCCAMISLLCALILIVLMGSSSILITGVIAGTSSLSNSLLYQAPDECRWTGGTDVDITLVCRLRTINSELENTNFSVIQPQNTIRLRLECNDALYFQSSISPGSFLPLVELRSLSINYCKIGNLTNGSFNGLKELRNLTIQTHNTDWSSMSLEIADKVFTSNY